jgi:hypothetical protein
MLNNPFDSSSTSVKQSKRSSIMLDFHIFFFVMNIIMTEKQKIKPKNKPKTKRDKLQSTKQEKKERLTNDQWKSLRSSFFFLFISKFKIKNKM